MAKAKESLNTTISKAIKGGFDLEGFKKNKFLVGNVKFKEDKWIELSQSYNDRLSTFKSSCNT